MSAAFASSVSTPPCTTRSGSVPLARAATIHDVSPGDPSGPGSKTKSADTWPAATACRNPDRSAGPLTDPLLTSPSALAPSTFGASTAGTLNVVPLGCDFSQYV